MQTTTIHPDAAQSLVERSVKKNRAALASILATFEATPDEKLDFKPSETANSVREMVSHVIGGNGYVGGAMGLSIETECNAADRKQLAEKLANSTQQIIDKIQSLTPEELGSTVEFFGMKMPMSEFILINEWHVSRHAGQIDYVQTIYGDLEDHG